MTKLNRIKEIIKKNKKELKEKYQVKKIGIFCSYVRGEEKKVSDMYFFFLRCPENENPSGAPLSRGNGMACN